MAIGSSLLLWLALVSQSSFLTPEDTFRFLAQQTRGCGNYHPIIDRYQSYSQHTLPIGVCLLSYYDIRARGDNVFFQSDGLIGFGDILKIDCPGMNSELYGLFDDGLYALKESKAEPLCSLDDSERHRHQQMLDYLLDEVKDCSPSQS